MALLAYTNHALSNGTFTGVTGTWSTNPPITNLGNKLIPIPYAQVVPDAGEIEFTFEALDESDVATDVDVRVVALLAHNLPDGAVVTFLDGVTELAEITWSPVARRNRPANVVAVLPSAVTLDTLTVNITSAGAAVIRIGGLWLSDAFLFDADRGADWDVIDYSFIERNNGNPWTNRRSATDVVECVVSYEEDEASWGETGVENFKGIFETVGTTEPVIYIRKTATQTDINLWSLYGLFPSHGKVQHRQGNLNRVTFQVEEVCD